MVGLTDEEFNDIADIKAEGASIKVIP